MAEDLVLDTAIRDWVLIPLSVVMVLIGILRYFVSKLMRSSPSPDAKMVKEGSVFLVSLDCDLCLDFGFVSVFFVSWFDSICFFFCRQVVIRARNLKAGANFIPPKSFRTRRFYFSNEVWFFYDSTRRFWFWQVVWFLCRLTFVVVYSWIAHNLRL